MTPPPPKSERSGDGGHAACPALALIGAIDALVATDAAAGLTDDEITRHGRELADLLLRATTERGNDDA